MDCPLCKVPGSLRFVVAGAFVECTTKGCPWTQTPLAELVCDAAVYTWHRQNPTPPALIDHPFEDGDFGDGECSAVVDEDPDSVTRCGHSAEEHEKAA